MKLHGRESEGVRPKQALWFEIVSVQADRPFVKKDPDDDKFIWCAVEGKADALLSGDDHLLKLKRSPVPVLPVSAFLKMRKERS